MKECLLLWHTASAAAAAGKELSSVAHDQTTICSRNRGCRGRLLDGASLLQHRQRAVKVVAGRVHLFDAAHQARGGSELKVHSLSNVPDINRVGLLPKFAEVHFNWIQSWTALL